MTLFQLQVLCSVEWDANITKNDDKLKICKQVFFAYLKLLWDWS
jgi:hypothetical protein